MTHAVRPAPLLLLLACGPAVSISDVGTEASSGPSDSTDAGGDDRADAGDGATSTATSPIPPMTSAASGDSDTTLGDGTLGDDTSPTSVCGDGILDPDEACDDGNDLEADGCAADCTDEPGWVAKHHVDAMVNAQFSAVHVADDGTVLAAGGAFQLFGDDVTGLVARYDAEGALLGFSPLTLDVATYAREIVDIGAGDAIVLVGSGPDFYPPYSHVQLLRLSPGASQPAWITDLFAGETALAGHGLVLDDDAVIASVRTYDSGVESLRLVRLDLDGNIVWDIDLGGPNGDSNSTYVMQDGDAVFAMVCNWAEDVTQCALHQVDDDGALTNELEWNVEGTVRDAIVVGDDVVLAGYGPSPEQIPTVWAWTSGAPTWTVTAGDDAGMFASIDMADDDTLVVTGFAQPDDDTFDALLYRQLGIDGTVLDAPEPIADHLGFAVTRRGGTTVIGGEFDYGTVGMFGDEFVAFDAWLYSTGD